jgi:hypothetical protein
MEARCFSSNQVVVLVREGRHCWVCLHSNKTKREDRKNGAEGEKGFTVPAGQHKTRSVIL